MINKKYLKFKVVLDINGKVIKNYPESTIVLSVSENSGNYLIHKDILRQLLTKKQSTASTKTRGEISGGGRKPWRQKGTGRARAGSTRSPLFKGGGVIFGPKSKTIKHKINHKERQLARKTLLANKYSVMTKLIDNIENILQVPKTKMLLQILQNCNVDLQKRTLLIIDNMSMALKFSSRNIKNLQVISATNLNTLNLLKTEQIILTPLALLKIQEIYGE